MWRTLELNNALCKFYERLPCSVTQEESWERECIPDFFRILLTWVAAVCSEITNSEATSRLVRPRATSFCHPLTLEISKVAPLGKDAERRVIEHKGDVG